MTFLSRWLQTAAEMRSIRGIIAVGATTLALLFCFALYPSMQQDLQLDPEAYSRLGEGLWRIGTLSFYPETAPTMVRGPVYPFFIAIIYAISDGWYPYSIQIGNCFLFGLTCWFAFGIAERVHGRRAAVVAAIVTAVHPLTLGFAGKIVLENITTPLFTALLASTLWWIERPRPGRSLVVGIVLGLLSIAKATFLPFVLLLPLLLLFVRDRSYGVRHVALIAVVASLFGLGWAIRNELTTGIFTPSQPLAGYNFRRGDIYIDSLPRFGPDGGALWGSGDPEFDTLGARYPERWPREVYIDSTLLRQSLERYRRDPGFLLKKVAINAVLFWCLGNTTDRTIGYAVVQFALLILFTIGIGRRLRRTGLRSIEGVHLIVIVVYVAVQLPIFAFFRLSSVLIPTLIAYASGAFGFLRQSELQRDR